MRKHFSLNFHKAVLTVLLVFTLSVNNQLAAQTEREIADSNRVFDWAERNLSEFFAPAGVSTLTIEGYVVRFYSKTNSWLGTNNGRVYVFGEAFDAIAPTGLSLKTIGDSEQFLAIANRESQVPGITSGTQNELLAEADRNQTIREGSPVRRINRPGRPRGNSGNDQRLDDRPGEIGIRSIEGHDNNLANPIIGAAGTQLKRLVPADYSDGVSALAGSERASARTISNVVSAQSDSVPNPMNASDMLWQWGQFLDHDIDLTDGANPPEPANISVPAGDPYFDPTGTGIATISLNRSLYDETVSEFSPRQQINEVTSWIDASNVYGSDEERTNALRTLTGDGKMKVSEGDLLPFNIDGFSNAGGDSSSLFFAGDVRANEQLGLTAMHTLFVREHNRLSDEIAFENPDFSGEEIFQETRRIVGAQMQAITYNEYLPALLGHNALDRYEGYDDSVDATISNLFSTAAYRYGHSALSPTLIRIDANGAEIDAGHIALRDAFFSPHKLAAQGGLEPLLRGLAAQICQNIDLLVIDDVRNFLFGPPGSGGFDLVSLNIQRGRDHGLPTYNATRMDLGLAEKLSFADISSDPEVQSRLAEAYENVNQIDLWVGGLAEEKLDGALVGELMFTVFKQQFEALRDGDRFWYQASLSNRQANRVQNTSLADIIRRNTEISDEIGNDVFHVN